jgi:glycosyltransferase involved in cell wall biosynthesis
MTKPVVSVVMITYAHENYIEQAIKSVLMQECDFEVELIITNDCSPDNTDAVIMDIVKTHPKASWIKYIKHKKNIGMMSNFVFTLKEANGKYIALCEGDDFWVDPFKLQKQVEFLEKKFDYVMSFTNSYEYIEVENVMIPTEYPKNISNLTFSKLLDSGWFIRTATILFRKDQLDLEFLSKINYGADYFIHLLLINQGKFHFLNETTSVYRHHIGGISKSNSAVYLERRFQYISNLQLLDNYFERKFHKEIGNEISNVRINIFDFALLNSHFQYLKKLKIIEILPLLYHLQKRLINKIIRLLKLIK